MSAGHSAHTGYLLILVDPTQFRTMGRKARAYCWREGVVWSLTDLNLNRTAPPTVSRGVQKVCLEKGSGSQ